MAICVSYAATDTGYVRERNEDFYFASDELGLYVIADGMGGQPRGDVASQTAVAAVTHFLSQRRWRKPRALDSAVCQSVLHAHSRVVHANKATVDRGYMGTTLCVLALQDRFFSFAGVGDSKCFWIFSSAGRRQLVQISRDDTVAASLRRNGVPEGLISRQEKHTLTQAIGLTVDLRPHVASGSLEPSDVLLMCSDGITEYMSERAFRDVVLASANNPRTLVDSLIEAALAGGGGDNCTCICILATR